MKLIVEGFPYNSAEVQELLADFHPLEKDGIIRMDYIGYFYSSTINDCIFFLPKVIVDQDNHILGRHCSPTDVLDLDTALVKEYITPAEYYFLSNLSVWIYRAINVFRELKPNNEIVLRKAYSVLDKSGFKTDSTYLDILLSLIKFNNENREFFLFIIKNAHSGYNKINWTKTISKKQAFFDDDQTPIYINVINRKKQVNFDEELIIIYYSILKYIASTYGFKSSVDYNYDLIGGEQFKHFINGYGLIRLRQIKYKYYSDKAIELWNLCYSFFEKAQEISSASQQSDYLLVKDFNIVFENMIDTLIGDPEESLPDDLKDQPDGKRVDHIYEYESLISADRIYYIGDSKYYKMGNDVVGESVFKQFTYAKNVIQTNLNLLLDDKFHRHGEKYLEYRDSLTEGYNVTPNFFISAKIPSNRSFDEDDLSFRSVKGQMSRQFENRLFDRDTLWVSHYDVNFLYITALYGGGNVYAQQSFKDKARLLFREKTISAISDNYAFYLMKVSPKTNLSLVEAININFRNLIGRIFRPFKDRNLLLLALYVDDFEYNRLLLDNLMKYFTISHFRLGDDPEFCLANYPLDPGTKEIYVIKHQKGEILPEDRIDGYNSNR